MHFEIPHHAKEIPCDDALAWLWKTALGWSLYKSPYQIDLENIEREGVPCHTIDWRSHTQVEDGLYRDDPGHLSLDAFKEMAIELARALTSR